tara:strand:+ start:236 stop:454 length:219 start_codon:yes stop_codon:yes gene_type:complete
MIKTLLACCLLASNALASENISDQYPNSMLYSKPVEFIPGVFSAIGATAPRAMTMPDTTTTSASSSLAMVWW